MTLEFSTYINAVQGTATVNITGGVAPYTIQWVTSPVQTTATATGLDPGTYTVIVTDANGCVEILNVHVPGNSNISLTPSKTDISACGANDGTASVTPSGGSAPYTYLWSPGGQTTPSISGLAPGTYTVTVDDANSCPNTATIIINDVVNINVTSTITDVLCPGEATGSVSTNVSGGAAPYTYSWNTTPVQTGATATGLTAGFYTVTVTDANGCQGIHSLAVNQPPAFVITPTGGALNCAGDANGSVSVSVSGGTPGYTYSWNTSPVQTGTTATGLTVGTYTVTVTDTNGCQEQEQITVSQPSPMDADMLDNSTIDCSGNFTGAAETFVTGGTSPYSYLWCDGTTGISATGLVPGTCALQITDANGCIINDSITIVNPGPMNPFVDKTDACSGGTGTATAQPNGGQQPHSYSWSHGPTTQTVSGLAPGSYTVTITDGSGCVETVSVTIASAPPLDVTATIGGTCAPGDGSVTLSVSGGTPPYTYTWNTGATTPNLSNLVDGVYTVYVWDANNCFDTLVAVISNPSGPVIDDLAKQDASCNTNDGQITVTASNGTPPYQYSINGGPFQSGNVFTGLGPGLYTVTVRDANGCETTGQVTINQQGNARANFSANPVLGTPPLDVFLNNNSTGTTFYWNFGNGTGDTTTLPNGTLNTTYPSTGTYVITLIVDDNGCTDTMRVTITVFPNSLIIVPNVFTPNGDGRNDVFKIRTEGIETLNVQIYNRWGTYLAEITQPDGFWDGTDHPDGTYFFLLKATGFDGKEYDESGHFMLKR